MSRDLTGDYRDAQAFKERWKNGPEDEHAIERLRQAVNEMLARRGMTRQQRHAALYTTLRGIAWVSAMAAEYDLDIDTLLDAPDEIARNTLANAHGLGFDSQSIELGIGAGYFTGLLVGLKAGSRR